MGKKKGKQSTSRGPGDSGETPEQSCSTKQETRSREPQVPPGQAPQGPPSQTQGNWRRGTQGQTTQGPPPQPQGAWGRGTQGQTTQGPPPQPQGAWGRETQGRTPQGPPPQPQGAWGRGTQGQTAQGPPPQPQGAWGRETQGRTPQEPPPQPQGAWGRGTQGQTAQGPPPQPQGAWGRGTQGQTAQGPPPQPQRAWGRGTQGQTAQGPPPQPQRAWGRGTQGQTAQEPPPQPQGAWGRGTQAQTTQRPPPQPQGAWGRGTQAQTSQEAWGRGPGGDHVQTLQPQGAWGKKPQAQTSQEAWGRGPGGDDVQTLQPQGTYPRGPQSDHGEVSDKPPQLQEARSNKPSSDISDEQVTKSSHIKEPKGKKSPEFQASIEFAPRIYAPKKFGRQIKVASNFFPLYLSDPNITVFHYDVLFEPDKPKFLLRTVWNKFVSLMFPHRLTAFDGKNAYSKGPLTDEKSVSATVTVLNVENNKEKDFKVEIKKVREISFSCFNNFLQKIRQEHSMKVLPEAELSVLNIILRNWACDNFIRSGDSFFSLLSSNPKSIDLSNKLCMRFGYFQSAFLGYKLYLNFDISHKPFYRNCSVLDILECFKSRKTQDIDAAEMSRFLRSVKVEYVLPNQPSTKRIFRVNKLVKDANHQCFEKEDGTEISVKTYFEREKKCRLRYPDLPLLWVGSTQKTIYIPMEFCTILPDQIYRGPMDPLETRAMVQKSTSNARDRKKNVQTTFNVTNINCNSLMREFGLRVSNEMEIVPARVLDPPRLKTSQNVKVDRGVWKIQDFLNPVSLNKWCILNLDKYLPKQNIDNLQNMIKNKGNDFNMRVSDPSKSTISGDPSFNGLKKVFSQLKDMQMVFVIIPDLKIVYSRVKAICETEDGILTQCVKSRTVSQDPRKLMTTVQNILLKVNAKLGGRNHCLDQSSTPQCLNGYVMVAGADVTHSSPGMTIPSVAAVTVSCEPAAFQYSTTTRVQPKGEMIKDFQEIMTKHLKEFYKIRGQYPEKIIFFRDGVSEGELEKVFKEELAALRRACSNYCQPKITFIVVQKRHHTRFYPTNTADEQDKNYNVPVGTCVDSDIVHPRDLNFYLVSHASILGTARPTKYRLLHDDSKLTDDEIERLSYYLCHLFARCNRSVSYPAPTYNAHLAAARVRAYLEGLNLLGGQDVNTIQTQIKDEISKISPMFFV